VNPSRDRPHADFALRGSAHGRRKASQAAQKVGGAHPRRGRGSQRLYSFRDILVLKVVKKLLDAGVSLQQVRVAVGSLQNRGVDDLASITLMSDGASVYECTSTDEVIDLLQGGQGVFGIAVGRVWREVECSLAELPLERPDDRSYVDDLAVRRHVKRTAS